MKALVTGATGFVGSHLVEALAARGDSVTALVRSPGKAGRLGQLGVRQVPGDLHSPDALRQALTGQDVVFHVAGLVAARNEAEFLRANRDGTSALLQSLGPESPRFVLVSSMAAAGPSTPDHPLIGNEAPHPVTAYGRSKLAGEAALQGAAVPWTILRPPMVYGPRDTEVLKVFKIARLGVAPIFGDGSQQLSAISGPDLAEALIAAALAPAAVGRIFYPCHPEIFSSGDFVRAVGRALGRTVRVVPLPLGLARLALTLTGAGARLAGRATILTADKANEFFQPAWTGDPHGLMSATGWAPRHDLATGLALTAAWYREHRWL